MKKIIDVLSASVIAGLLVGLGFSVREIVKGDYVKYDILRLGGLSLQEHLNKWTALAVGVSVGALVIFYVAKLAWKWFFSKMVEVQVKDKRRLVVFVICCVFFVCVGWTVNHYWLPHKFERVSLFADVVILLFTVGLWFLLTRIRWAELYGLKLRSCIRKAALILLLCLLGLNLGVGLWMSVDARRRPNIILISIDTLRWDHLGCYGYERNTTPNIDEFAKESLFFEDAYSPWPVTVPALNSMMTGCLISNEPGEDITSYYCETTYLAEILTRLGYYTVGFTDHSVLGSKTRGRNEWYVVRRGFSTFLNFGKGRKGVTSDVLTRNAITWLSKNHKDSFFLWVHYFDPHHNYNPLPEYEGLFGFSEKDCGRIYNPMDILEVREIEESLTGKEIECLMCLYDSEIFYTDMHIGRLLDKIKELKLWEDSVIIITADHGEEFKERERVGHGTSVYNEVIRVPLMVKIPDRAPGIIRGNIGTEEVFNIVWDLVSNKEMKLNDEDIISRTHPSSRAEKPDANDFTIVSGDYKYICNPETGNEEFYALREDVSEQNNLLADSAYEGKKLELKQKLASWLRENKVDVGGSSKESLESREELDRQLKALGYVR
ncbi:MAG: sulfatase [Planctomycetota bacterium]|nr:MAG: sulfatase [Planctomycetota bacterium]